MGADGGGWEAEGVLNHPWAQEQSHCVFSKTQKQPQCNSSGQDSHWQQLDTTCSLICTPQWHQIPHSDDHEFTGSENAACESKPGYL